MPSGLRNFDMVNLLLLICIHNNIIKCGYVWHKVQLSVKLFVKCADTTGVDCSYLCYLSLSLHLLVLEKPILHPQFSSALDVRCTIANTTPWFLITWSQTNQWTLTMALANWEYNRSTFDLHSTDTRFECFFLRTKYLHKITKSWTLMTPKWDRNK
jgi:hypothetical protein